MQLIKNMKRKEEHALTRRRSFVKRFRYKGGLLLEYNILRWRIVRQTSVRVPHNGEGMGDGRAGVDLKNVWKLPTKFLFFHKDSPLYHLKNCPFLGKLYRLTQSFVRFYFRSSKIDQIFIQILTFGTPCCLNMLILISNFICTISFFL